MLYLQEEEQDRSSAFTPPNSCYGTQFFAGFYSGTAHQLVMEEESPFPAFPVFLILFWRQMPRKCVCKCDEKAALWFCLSLVHFLLCFCPTVLCQLNLDPGRGAVTCTETCSFLLSRLPLMNDLLLWLNISVYPLLKMHSAQKGSRKQH